MGFRAFIAVSVGSPPAIARVLGELARVEADLKVVPPENVHVTLAFLGQTDERLVPKVRDAMASAARGVAPMDVTLRGLGTFPPHGSPRVIWVAMEGASALSGMEAALRPPLGAVGFELDARPFQPHLTLARARSARGAADVRAFVEARSTEEFGTVRIEDVRLYKSHLSPKGPTYDVVECVPLGAAA
ncbi:MAG: RNA 2',3'-cyclic phosphodiesterase [Thermoplasmatota archaeon]